MKRMLITLLFATVVCVAPVNAQTLTDGYFTFILPDQYEESSVNSYFELVVLNDINKDNILLGIMDGVCFYDALN